MLLTVSFSIINENGSDAVPASFTEDGIKYNTIGGTTDVSVVANGYTGEIVIPEVVIHDSVSYNVISIGANAFKGTNVSAVTLPDTVTSLGTNSFYETKFLVDLTIPDSVTSLGNLVFYGSGIHSVTIGSGVTSIPPRTFFKALSLTSIEIPDNVITIGNEAFAGAGITSASIGTGTTTVGIRAFNLCNTLTSLMIPDVEHLDTNAFSNCTNLTTVYVGKGIGDNSSAFYGCSNLVDVTFGPDVTRIGDGSFQNCTSLEVIDIFEGITTIGAHAFQNTRINTLTLPSSITEIGTVAFYGCSNLNNLSISNSVIVNPNAFDGCNVENMTVFHDVDVEPTKSILNVIDAGWNLTNTTTGSHITIIMTKDLNMASKLMMTHWSTIAFISFVENGGSVVNYGDFNNVLGVPITDPDYMDEKTFVRNNASVSWTEVGNCAIVTFDGNGGTVNPSRVAVTLNGFVSTLPLSTRAGYTGAFYYNDGTGDQPFTSTTAVTGNMTVFVKWSLVTYTISYDSNGGIGSIPSDNVTTADVASSYRLPSSSAFSAPAGKHFIGWSIDASSSLYEAGSKIPVSLVTRNLNMVAMWGSNGYSVSYELLGGTPGTNVPESWTVGVSKVVSSPTRAGFDFIGWKISGDIISSALYGLDPLSISTAIPANGLIEFDASEIYFIDLSTNGGSITLTAQWRSTGDDSSTLVSKIVKVSFDCNGGYPVNSITVKYGQAYGALPMPTNEGHVFCGWYLKGTLISSTTTVTTSGNHTLIAMWDNDVDADIGNKDSSDTNPLIVVFAASSLLLMMLMILAYVKVKKD